MELFEAVTDLESVLSELDNTTYNWSNFARILSNVHIVHNHQELAHIADYLVTKLSTSQIFFQELIDKLDKRISSYSSEKDKGSNWLQGLRLVLDKLDAQHRQRRILENLVVNLTSRKDPNAGSSIEKKKKKTFQLSSFMDKILEEESNIIPLDVHAVFEDVEDYLKVQKNLIVEDFFRPLRQSVKKMMTSQNLARTQSGVYSYGSGKLYSYSFGFKININIEDLNHIDWASTSRLMPGSLVILRHAYDRKSLSLWILKERDMINKDHGGYLSIALTPIQESFKPLNTDDQVEVFESVVYFEAYVHVIRALHTLAGPIPFEDQIVRLNPDLKIKCVQYLVSHKRHHQVVHDDIFDSAQLWSLLNDVNLEEPKEPLDFQSLSKGCNPSQMAAIRMGLEHSIGLIQGPPGTGKSYVGALLAKILMANTVKPIVVVCYTNHSLDTFLESLMNHTAKIVRIGGRSKSQRLEPFNLGKLTFYKEFLNAKRGQKNREICLHSGYAVQIFLQFDEFFDKNFKDLCNVIFFNNFVLNVLFLQQGTSKCI